MSSEDIDWNSIDKTKFLVYGAGLFSGLTTTLYPLSVIKTRQMVLDGAPSGIWGATRVARDVVRTNGVRGLYRGFDTVIIGIVPARALYLTTLERMKVAANSQARKWTPNEATSAAAANFVAGATASLVTQSVVVPIDVISQRLMVAGEGGSYTLKTDKGAIAAHNLKAARQNGFQLAMSILQKEGIRGLYRGMGASIATFVPTSAIWWSAYGGYQKAIWHQIDRRRGLPETSDHRMREWRELLLVQGASAISSGVTSSILTNPLDVVKTRLQVAERQGAKRPSFFVIGRQLIRRDGVPGLWRGVIPRIYNSALWSTAMITTYEYLKRVCALPPDADGRRS